VQGGVGGVTAERVGRIHGRAGHAARVRVATAVPGGVRVREPVEIRFVKKIFFGDN
jgi:hypothetical protein